MTTPDHCYAYVLQLARANLAHVPGADHGEATRRAAARAALQEAHSARAQPTLFPCLDALGGHLQVLARLTQDLH